MATAQPWRKEIIGIRETVESIWVAIILAFVVRAFVLEAFVIPTGSMAPRLMGQHVLLTCPDCGYEFPFGLAYDGSGHRARGAGPVGKCPNCGSDVKYNLQDNPPRSGDRVLVLKYLYKFQEPRRWDVVVFRNPQTNRDNYIKRLVGLPGEALRIIMGDLFVCEIADVNGDGVKDKRDLDTNADGRMDQDEWDALDWLIARKDPQTQRAVLQLINDNDYRPSKTDGPVYWKPARSGDSAWRLDGNGGRVFAFDAPAPSELRFADDHPEKFQPRYGYNPPNPERQGGNSGTDEYCYDLKLQTMLVRQSDQGQVSLKLAALENEFQAEFNFDGTVKLLRRPRGDDPDAPWTAWDRQAHCDTLARRQTVRIAISRADWQVIVWVDDEPVIQTTHEYYKPDVAKLIERARKADSNRAGREALPVPGASIIGQQGRFELWHTQIVRDVFYTNSHIMMEEVSPESYKAKEINEAYSDGDNKTLPGWGTMDKPIVLRAWDDKRRLDEFFMLGDNSPQSKDSRWWVQAAPTLELQDQDKKDLYRLGTVPRYNLIGKAFFVYWPAGHNLPFTKLPIVPNVGKMRLIH